MSSPAGRRGFTLIELLIVIGIIGLLMGLLLPAIHKVRESSNSLACKNNQRQMALALMHYESITGTFPEGYRFDPPTRSFFPLMLPLIDMANVQYDKFKNWDDPVNQAAAQAQIKILFCPSVPTGPRVDASISFRPAVSDYTVYHGVNHGYCDMVQWPRYAPEDQNGALTTKPCRVRDIRDGVSETFILAECCGRPDLWRGGNRRIDGVASAGGWSDPNLEIALDGSDNLPTGQGQGFGPCVMNCTNDNEAYSFHIGGCNFAFCDGSVRFIRQTIKNTTFAALVTKAAGDHPPPEDY